MAELSHHIITNTDLTDSTDYILATEEYGLQTQRTVP